METEIAATFAATPMELTLLGWSVILGIVMLAVHIVTAIPAIGPKTAASSREGDPRPTGGLAGRARRAFANYMETYPFFAAAILGLIVSGQTGGLGLTGAQLWFWARVAYAPIYYAGIPVIRTLAFVISIIGLILMVYDLLA